MEIIKYKKLKNGKYELTLSDDRRVELYEDVILKYNLLLSKKLDIKDKDIFDYNIECEVYYTGLKLLKTRTRSKKEVKDKLVDKSFSVDLVEKAIDKLEQQGFINDKFYASSFLNNKLITTTNGPFKIKKELQQKGIDSMLIDEVLNSYSEDIQKEKIKKIINRMIKSNRNKGNIILKKKIQTDLISQGFYKSLIDEEISNTTFPSDDYIAKKEYEKLYKKLSSKYSGSELEYKIKQKLYQKGLKYEV